MEYISISAALDSEQKGHFHEFHQSFSSALSGYGSVSMWGRKGNPKTSPKWFEGVIPRAASRPIPSISLFRIWYLLRKRVKKETRICVYEGNLLWICIASLLSLTNKDHYFLINLFPASRYSRVLKWPMGKFILSNLLNSSASISKNRVIVTCDTETMINFLQAEIGIKVSFFPIFTTLKVKNAKHKKTGKVLAVVRGKNGRLALQNALKAGNLSRDITIHGLGSESIYQGLNSSRVFYSAGYIDGKSYSDQFDEFEDIVLLYESLEFQFQSSGRYLDALAANCNAFVPKGTSMDYLGARLGGTTSFSYVTGELTAILNGEVKPPVRKPNFDMTSGNTAKTIVKLFDDCRDSKPNDQVKGNLVSIVFIIQIYLCSQFLSFITANGFLKPSVMSDLIRRRFNRQLNL